MSIRPQAVSTNRIARIYPHEGGSIIVNWWDDLVTTEVYPGPDEAVEAAKKLGFVEFFFEGDD